MIQSCWDVSTGTKGTILHLANRRCYDRFQTTIYDVRMAEDTIVAMHDTLVLDFLGQPIDRYLACARGRNGTESSLTTRHSG